MALEPHELEVLTRIDERTKRMDEEYERRFRGVHARIDEVKADLERDVDRLRDDARNRGAGAGAGVSAVVGPLAAWLWQLIRGG